MINNYPVAGGKASLGLHPGRHKLTAEAPGYAAEEWIIDAAPASAHAHVFKLAPNMQAPSPAAPEPTSHHATNTASPTADSSPAKPRGVPTGVYIGAAATAAFVAAATVTGILTFSKQSDYKNAPDASEADRLSKSGKTLALVTDIEIGAAVLSAGVTAYLYFTAPTPTQNAGRLEWRRRTCSDSRSPARSESMLRITPAVNRQAAGLAITGNF